MTWPARVPIVIGVAAIAVVGAGFGASQAVARPTAPTAIEPTTTRWAHVLHATAVSAQPSARSPQLARLRSATYLGRPEVVLVTRRSPDGRWSRVRYPQRGVRLGWVPSATLGPLREVRTRLIIDRDRQRLSFYRGGRRVVQLGIGVGAAGSPTPPGHFYVREKLAVRPAQPVYGPRAIGLSAYSRHRTFWPGGGQVGIHGTDQPQLVPGRPSNGCVRLHNGDIRRLYDSIPIGTPVTVR